MDRPDIEALQAKIESARGRGWFAVASDEETEALCAYIRHLEAVIDDAFVCHDMGILQSAWDKIPRETQSSTKKGKN